MTEYEWEPGRVARRAKPEFLGTYQPRSRELEEFVALEHPRESIGWFLRSHAEATVAPVPPSASSSDKRSLDRPPVRAEPQA